MSCNALLVGASLLLLCSIVSISAITDEQEASLLERISYYSTQIKNTSAQNPYSSNEYTMCSYYDVCNFDVDSVVWSVRKLIIMIDIVY
jgi:hypothetical protein